MNRAILLPTIAALAGGCVITSPDTVPPICNAPNLNLYWTPSPSPPQGGFRVPGLPVPGWPAQLGCDQAGVGSVQLTLDGANVPCPISTLGTTYCVDGSTWRCEFPVAGTIEGGIQLPLNFAGDHRVRLDGFDANGNQKYTTGPLIVTAPDCSDTSVGIFPQGLPGTLEFDYAFDPTTTCAPGSNIGWTLAARDPVSQVFSTVETAAVACGAPGAIFLAGGAQLPAGVYTFPLVEEFVPGGATIHARCTTTPGYQAFVHAGPELIQVVMPQSTQICPPP